MPKQKSKCDPIPENFAGLEQFTEFWDSHSLADYGDMLRETECRINIVRQTRLVPVEPEVLNDLAAYGHSHGLACEALINLWLREHLTTMTAKRAGGVSRCPAWSAMWWIRDTRWSASF